MMPTSGKNNALGNQDAAFNLLGQRIKNLRFTQSYVQALADVEAIGKGTRLLLSSYGNLAAWVPALKTSRFNFTGAAV